MVSVHDMVNRRRETPVTASGLVALIPFLMAVLTGPDAALGKSPQNTGKSEFQPGTQVVRIQAGKKLVDPPSTLDGDRLVVSQVIQYAYAAGFQSEDQLVAATAIAISESGLFSAARNWHPEKGFRPVSDVITVKGPKNVWSNGGQMHSDRGIWQIASHWFPEYSDVVADSPQISAIIAFNLSKGGIDFEGWDSYKNHNAQKLFDRPYDGWPAVRPIVKRFLLRVRPPPQPLDSHITAR
jgi:hypothetical protein